MKQYDFLFCFNFDQTITLGHLDKYMYLFALNEDNCNVEEVLNAVKLRNPEQLKKSFEDIVKNKGAIAITNYGKHKKLMMAALRKAGISEEILANVVIISQIEYMKSFYDASWEDTKNGKNNYIYLARKHFNLLTIPNSWVVLLDDDKNNIDKANEQGYRTVHITEQSTGFVSSKLLNEIQGGLVQSSLSSINAANSGSDPVYFQPFVPENKPFLPQEGSENRISPTQSFAAGNYVAPKTNPQYIKTWEGVVIAFGLLGLVLAAMLLPIVGLASGSFLLAAAIAAAIVVVATIGTTATIAIPDKVMTGHMVNIKDPASPEKVTTIVYQPFAERFKNSVLIGQ